MNYLPKSEYAEDQRFSKTILTTHVVMKGVQAGSTIGLTTGLVYGLFKKIKTKKFIKFSALGKCSGFGMLIGPIITSSLLTLKMQNEEEIGWKDRAWRLQRNIKQQQSDVYTASGVIAGSILKTSLFKGNVIMKTITGGGYGAVAGLLTYLIVGMLMGFPVNEEYKK